MPERIKANKIKNILIENGMREITTYSFISSRALAPLNLSEDDPRNNGIKLLNPLGDEYSVMRTQLLTSMLNVLSTNYNRKIGSAKMFELSKIFRAKSLPLTEQPDEVPHLCLGMYGQSTDNIFDIECGEFFSL